jgi:hypothetical protein
MRSVLIAIMPHLQLRNLLVSDGGSDWSKRNQIRTQVFDSEVDQLLHLSGDFNSFIVR